MLTRVLFVAALMVAAVTSFTINPAGAETAAQTIDAPKLVALGLAKHEVTAAELTKGDPPAKPAFNTPAIAYALVENLKKGDVVEVIYASSRNANILHNQETVDADKKQALLMAGRTAVPVGGWQELPYYAHVTVTRDGKTLIDVKSKPWVIK